MEQSMTAQVRTFRAPDARSALAAVKAALGAEAVILSSREVAGGIFGRAQVEITAALGDPEPPQAQLATRLQTARPPWLPGRRRVVALIGPPGVGKTTTIAKIAAHAVLSRSRPRVALVTVDNYRIGAREHLARYGEILDLPVLAAKSVGELERTVAAQS